MINKRNFWLIFPVLAVLIISSSCKPQPQLSEEVNTLAPVLDPTETKRPENVRHRFTADGEDITYWLHTPTDLIDGQPTPVVFVIHGFMMSPKNMYPVGFNALADSEKFIVVYPDLETSQFRSDIINLILEDLGTFIKIDSKRIYVTGFSFGSDVAYYSACDMSDVVAAIASVSEVAACKSSEPEYPVSVMHIHGLADVDSPYEGNGTFPPAEEIIAYWVLKNDCTADPQVEKHEGITHTSYSACQEDVNVELYTIEGMGHKWPDEEMSATQIIWEFFITHPKP